MESYESEDAAVDLKPDRNLKVKHFKIVYFTSEISTDGPYFPEPITLAKFAKAAYKNPETIGSDVQTNGWRLLMCGYNDGTSNRYFGAAFWNPTRNQVVISHRGTKHNYGSYYTDFKSVMLNSKSERLLSAITFVEEVLKKISNFKTSDGAPPQVFITGHSLGGWLAQVTALTGEFLKRKNSQFVKRKSYIFHIHTVVFESPGCEEMLSKLKRIIDDCEDRYNEGKIDLNSLDITHYMSVPNLINTYKRHIGRIFELSPDEKALKLFDLENLCKMTKEYHKIEFVLTCLESSTPVNVIDWPVSKAFSSNELKKVLEWKKKQVTTGSSEKNLRYKQRQLPEDKLCCPINVFTQTEKEFLILLKENLNSGAELMLKLQDNYKRLLPEYDIASGMNHVQCKSPEDLNIFIRKTKELCQSEEIIDEVRKSFSQLNIVSELYLKYLSTIVISEMINPDVVLRDTINLCKFLKSETNFIMSLKASEGSMSLTLLKIQGILKGVLESNEMNTYFLKLKELLEISYYVNFKNLTVANSSNPRIIIVLCSVSDFSRVYDVSRELLKTRTRHVKFVFLHFFESNPPLPDSNIIFQSDQAITFNDLSKDDQKFIFDQDLFQLEHSDDTFSLKRLFENKVNLQSTAVQTLYSELVNCSEFWNNIAREKTIKLPVLISAFEQKFLSVIIERFFTESEVSVLLKKHTEAVFIISEQKTSDSVHQRIEEILLKDTTLGSHFKMCSEPSDSETLHYIIPKESDHQDTTSCQNVTVFKMFFIENKFYLAEAQASDIYIRRFCKQKYIVRKEVLKDEHLSKAEIFFVISPSGTVSVEHLNQIKVLSTEDMAKIKFNELCSSSENKVKNIHLIAEEHDNGEVLLVWKSSHGCISNIRKYVTLDKMSFPEENMLYNNDKVTIIAGEPGSGKSQFLLKLVSILKDKWCIYKTLKEIRESIKNIHQDTSIDDVVNIFHPTTTKKNDLASLLFKFCLQNEATLSVCFLLDGFDEVTEADQKNAIKLIKFLRSFTTAYVYVSSRKSDCQILEDSFCIFSTELKPLGSDDQKEFLSLYWDLEHVCSSERCHVTRFVDNTLAYLADVMHDSVSFLGIPLQMRMLAETLSPDCKDLLMQIPIKNISDLFHCFVKRKYDIYFTMKNALGELHSVIRKVTEGDAENYHQALALEELFDQDKSTVFLIRMEKESLESLGNGIGMVQNGKFIHRTFAEYFFVRQICGMLEDPNLGSENSSLLYQFFFKNIFQRSTFRTVRIFLNNIMERSELFTKLKQLFGIVENPYDGFKGDLNRSVLNLTKENHHILLSSVLYGVSEPCLFFFESLNENLFFTRQWVVNMAARFGFHKSLEVLIDFRRISETKNEEGLKSVLEYFSKRNRNKSENKNNQLEKVLPDQLIEEVRKADYANIQSQWTGDTPLHVAASAGEFECLNLLITKGARVNTVNHSRITALHLAADKGHTECVKLLLQNNASVNSLSIGRNTPLHYAAKNGHIESVKLLLKKSAICNAQNAFKATPLHHAASSGCSECVELLITEGANINVKNWDGGTPLHEAVVKKSAACAEMLLKHGAEVNACDCNGSTPLHLAAENKSLVCVRMLVMYGAGVNVLDKNNDNPVHKAAEDGCEHCIDFLAESGGSVNAKNVTENTALHKAASFDSIGSVYKLLKHKSDPNIQNNEGRTPLHYSVGKPRIQCTQRLLTYGANINARDKSKNTPLHSAALVGRVDCIRLLIDRGADVNARNNEEDTPLHNIMRGRLWCHPECVEALITANAEVNAKNVFGVTPLHDASMGGWSKSVEILLRNRADPNALNNDSETPLHKAARREASECAEILIRYGAEVNILDKHNKSPMHNAIIAHSEECINLLLKHGGELPRELLQDVPYHMRNMLSGEHT